MAVDQIAWARPQQGNLPDFITSAIPVGSLLNDGLKKKNGKRLFINISDGMENHKELGAGPYLAVLQAVTQAGANYSAKH